MDIHGRLADFSLQEMLILCVDTMISGAVVVTVGTDRHTLYFAEGHLYHASGPDVIGYDALWPLFELVDASYAFYIGHRERIQTISDDTPAVLARAQKLAQEWAQMRPFVAGPRVVPALATPPSTDHVQIDEEDWPVLSYIDGQRTIGEIAQLASVEELAVCHSLLHLRQRGLTELGAERPRPQPQAAFAPAPVPIIAAQVAAAWDRGGTPGSFFTKVLATLPLDAPLPDELPPLPDPRSTGIPFDIDGILRLLGKP